MSPSKFNMTAIITAMDSITADELKNFLLDNLSTFDKGSKFTIFGGHHHSGPTNEKPTLENVHVDEYDLEINYNHHKVWICCVIHICMDHFLFKLFKLALNIEIGVKL